MRFSWIARITRRLGPEILPRSHFAAPWPGRALPATPNAINPGRRPIRRGRGPFPAGKDAAPHGGHRSIETGRNRRRAKIEAGMNSRTSGPAAYTADAATSEASAHKTPALAEGFVLLDDSTSLEAVSQLFEHPVEIIRADEPADVDSALAALQAGLSRGLHAAGFFSYELGYLLEPKACAAAARATQSATPMVWPLYESARTNRCRSPRLADRRSNR